MDKFDVIVVGAGVVGLAIAARLCKDYKKVLIIDKNARFGEETSSRNSEVIHAGIYYPKNSLKAQLCVEGKELLYRYCQERHIPHQRIGKLLVAHDDDEEAFLEKTLFTARTNGVHDLVWQSSAQLIKNEPELSASAALLSPSTGILDVHSYMQSLVFDIEKYGGMFVANTEMLSAIPTSDGFNIKLKSVNDYLSLSSRYLINSAGLHSTKLAGNIDTLSPNLIPKLYWCRGHYFSYSGKSPFKQLIYPIPEKEGLGIHASLDMGGGLKFGPDTQYIKELKYDVSEKLKNKFYVAIQKYFPNVEYKKLQPDYSGIRPKLQGEGEGFRDFFIQSKQQHDINGLVNLFGIDSPGLTSSLAIANYVAKVMLDD
ncbi:MAG: NAD(P)/FAD-dependent oxidoreductase [Colwelliaceae bacterium]|nr:NAD(P)/FAD-dependent oxidoreductase [Colwelliaceae bacterium]